METNIMREGGRGKGIKKGGTCMMSLQGDVNELDKKGDEEVLSEDNYENNERAERMKPLRTYILKFSV